MNEQPSQETIDRFDEAVDNATQAIIEEFEWLGLPEGEQLEGLMVNINNAIAQVMREWL